VLDFNFRSRTEEEERPRAVYILSEYNTYRPYSVNIKQQYSQERKQISKNIRIRLY
jgi:hypothetical protein